MARVYRMYIDGRWTDGAAADTLSRHSPADGELVATFPRGSQQDAEAAVQAARTAFDQGPWPRMTGAERAAVLRRAAEGLRSRAEEFARIESSEVGIPYQHISWLNWYCADVVDYFAGAAREVFGRSYLNVGSQMSLSAREPLGVAAVITPWNFPLVLSIWKIAAALAAGCTLVVKPAEETPGTQLALAGVLEAAGLPAGVYNVITGPGPELGDLLVTDPRVDKVAFTGSTATGQQIMARAAGTLKRLTLELGGKSPLVVCTDADLDRAVAAAGEVFFNAGQVCHVPARIIVQQGIYDRFVERFAALAASLVPGHPDSPETTLGPLVNRRQYQRVLAYYESGRRDGGEVVTGGGPVQGPAFERGFYVQPTIFARVRPEMAIAREEIFGPAACVFPFSDLDEALALVNGTPYGLAAGIFTRDLDRAMAFSKRVRAGIVWVNIWNKSIPELPAGGHKASGIGRELGAEGLESFLETKSIHLYPGGA